MRLDRVQASLASRAASEKQPSCAAGSAAPAAPWDVIQIFPFWPVPIYPKRIARLSLPDPVYVSLHKVEEDGAD